MSAISRRYNQTASTNRETYIAGSTIKKELTSHLSSFACHIQPLEAELAQTLQGGFGKAWLMFCPVLDIDEGDEVIVDGTDTYKVRGVETYDFSRNPHCEVVLTTFKS